jgi:hypothetical protein
VTERKFVYKNWKYAIEVFERLAKRKPFSERFRLEYFHLLSENTTSKKLLMLWILNTASIFKLWFDIFRRQISSPKQDWSEKSIVIVVTRNNVYLQTLKPVIEYLIENRMDIKIFCPQKHMNYTGNYLGPRAANYLYAIEGFRYKNGVVKKTVSLSLSFIIAVANGFWFTFQPVRQKIWLSPVFSRYALTEYFFGRELRLLFASGAKLISANDHWMWESLFFTAAREVKASGYVMQHGVIGDITYPIFAKQFLAWGAYDAGKFINEFGAKPDEVSIIGSPHFDKVYEKVLKSKTTANQYHKKSIVYLSQYFFNSNFIEPGYYQKIIDRFCELSSIAASYDKQLVIKLHPADKKEYYTGLPANVIISTEPLLEVLENTCLAFTIDSTAIFEAVMYGIPVMQSGIEGMIRGDLNFSGNGLCDHSNTQNGSENFVKDLLSDEERFNKRVQKANNALSHYYFELGKSVEKVYQLLY